MKTKYAVPNELVSDLMELDMVSDEAEALEKVASGEVIPALKQKHGALQEEFKVLSDKTGGLSNCAGEDEERMIGLSQDLERAESAIETLNELIASREG